MTRSPSNCSTSLTRTCFWFWYIGDDEAIHADEHRLQREVQIGDAREAGVPIVADGLLARHPAAAFGKEERGEGRGEGGVIVEMVEHRLDIMGVPGGEPGGDEGFGINVHGDLQ